MAALLQSVSSTYQRVQSDLMIRALYDKSAWELFVGWSLAATRFPPGFSEMSRLWREQSFMNYRSRSITKAGHHIGNVTYVAYLWFPWNCEFLLPRRMHTITTLPPAQSHIRLHIRCRTHTLFIMSKSF